MGVRTWGIGLRNQAGAYKKADASRCVRTKSIWWFGELGRRRKKADARDGRPYTPFGGLESQR